MSEQSPKRTTISFVVRGEVCDWLDAYAEKRSKTCSSVCEDIVVERFREDDLNVK